MVCFKNSPRASNFCFKNLWHLLIVFGGCRLSKSQLGFLYHDPTRSKYQALYCLVGFTVGLTVIRKHQTCSHRHNVHIVCLLPLEYMNKAIYVCPYADLYIHYSYPSSFVPSLLTNFIFSLSFLPMCLFTSKLLYHSYWDILYFSPWTSSAVNFNNYLMYNAWGFFFC